MIGRVNVGGGGSSGLPEFTYTGAYTLIDDSGSVGSPAWRLKLLSSGTLTFTKLGEGNGYVDIFCVGAGGGSSSSYVGAGGGYTKTDSTTLQKGIAYTATVGESTATTARGGTTTFHTVSASGGIQASASNAAGGSGSGTWGGDGGEDGYDGCNAAGAIGTGGYGQRTAPGPNGETGSTKEFGEATGDYYAGGGGGHWDNAGTTNSYGKGGSGGGGCGASYNGSRGGNLSRTGIANTGGGAGASHSSSASGGSGIIIIRNHRGS